MIGLVQMGGTEKDLTVDELEWQIGKLGGAWTPSMETKPTRNFKVCVCFSLLFSAIHSTPQLTRGGRGAFGEVDSDED